MGELTDAKKVEMIAFILDRHESARNDPDGDKYLSSVDYAMEAVQAVVDDDRDSSSLRMFLEPGD